MFSQREFSLALTIGFAVYGSGQALAQAPVFPSLNVGELSAFAVESAHVNHADTGPSTTWAMMLMGLLGLAGITRRHQYLP